MDIPLINFMGLRRNYYSIYERFQFFSLGISPLCYKCILLKEITNYCVLSVTWQLRQKIQGVLVDF